MVDINYHLSWKIIRLDMIEGDNEGMWVLSGMIFSNINQSKILIYFGRRFNFLLFYHYTDPTDEHSACNYSRLI